MAKNIIRKHPKTVAQAFKITEKEEKRMVSNRQTLQMKHLLNK